MVIKHRWRIMLGLVLLWSASALVTGFFVVQAYEGARGIEAKRQIKNRVFALRGELVELKDERAALERKVAMLRGPVLDGDLLDERVRAELGRVNKNDLVIFLKDHWPKPDAVGEGVTRSAKRPPARFLGRAGSGFAALARRPELLARLAVQAPGRRPSSSIRG